MPIVGTLKKQPGEILPFTISYSDVLDGRTATSIVPTAAPPAGITVTSQTVVGETYQAFVNGGAHGQEYIITVVANITIDGNVTRVEDEVRVKVKETP
jgi:hypothetical protein